MPREGAAPGPNTKRKSTRDGDRGAAARRGGARAKHKKEKYSRRGSQGDSECLREGVAQKKEKYLRRRSQGDSECLREIAQKYSRRGSNPRPPV